MSETGASPAIKSRVTVASTGAPPSPAARRRSTKVSLKELTNKMEKTVTDNGTAHHLTQDSGNQVPRDDLSLKVK
jgi:hypothetical protein